MSTIGEERFARIPVIRLWGVLLVPLQGNLVDQQVADLVTDTLEMIRRDGSQGLVLDLSGLIVVDSHLCAAFADLSTAARYMGVRTLLCGLNPDIAMTLQAMGIELRGVETAVSLEHALGTLGLRPAKAQKRIGQALMAAMLDRNPAADPNRGAGKEDAT